MSGTGCVSSVTLELTISKGEYADFIEYWINTKTNYSQRERMTYLYYVQSGGDLEVLLSDLKTNNLTLSQKCQADQNKTLEKVIYDEIIKNYGTATEKSIMIALMNENDERTRIQNYTGMTADQLLSAQLGTSITVEAAAAQFGCSTNVIVDQIFLQAVYSNNTQFETDKSAFNSQMSTAMSEFDNEYGQLPEGLKVRLPDGTEQEYSDTILYSAFGNRTYKFYIINDGIESEYTVTVSSIEHKYLEEYPSGYSSVGDGKHVSIYHCNMCENDVELEIEECIYGDDGLFDGNFGDYNSFSSEYEFWLDNGDGTHTGILKCQYCGDEISETESHIWMTPRGDYVSWWENNGDGTHSLHDKCWKCGYEVIDYRQPHEDLRGVSDEWPDGICDDCGESMP